MRDGHVGPLLATYRELDSATRARVDAHLETCAACRQLQAAYARQDRLLSDLPARAAPLGMLASVRGRLASASGAMPARRAPRAGLAAIILVLFFVFGGGALAVSAQALPGDFLYPVKRTVEQVTLTILSVPQQDAAYEDFLAERRRFEARQVLQLQRAAPAVEFGGDLEHSADGGWSVGGIPVELDVQAVEAAGLQPGETVQIVGDAQSGALLVRGIQRRHADPTRTPVVAPTATVSATPTSIVVPTEAATDAGGRRPGHTPTAAPTATPTDDAPTAEPTLPVAPTATPTQEPSTTPTRRQPPFTPRLPVPPATATPAASATPAEGASPTPTGSTDPRPPRPTNLAPPRPTTVLTPIPTASASDTPPPTLAPATVVVTPRPPRPTLPPLPTRPGPQPTRRR